MSGEESAKLVDVGGLWRHVGGDAELLGDVQRTFHTLCLEFLDRAAKSVVVGDDDELVFQIHRFKSAVGNLHAQRVLDFVSQLEMDVASKSVEWQRRAPQLESLLVRLNDELLEIIRDSQPPRTS